MLAAVQVLRALPWSVNRASVPAAKKESSYKRPSASVTTEAGRGEVLLQSSRNGIVVLLEVQRISPVVQRWPVCRCC